MKLKTTPLLVLLLFLASTAAAQELEVTVEVTDDALPPAQKEYLAGFKDKVERYYNEHRWTDVEFYGDKIPVRLSINFISGTASGDFSAQVVVDAQRRIWENGRPTNETSITLRLMDPKWSFSYIQGQPFTHDEYQFNEITTFFDYYAYLILGVDFDSYEPLLGTNYYRKALRSTQYAQTSKYAQEWQGTSNQYSRINIISEFLNAQYENFRTALYWYYYEGLDFLKTEPDLAQRSIAKALENIADILARTNARSLIMTSWLETKSNEFCSLLEGYPERANIMKAMMQADPPRSERYRKCSF